MMKDAYEVYCEWAIEHGKATLTREQWNNWVLAILENDRRNAVRQEREDKHSQWVDR